MFSVSPGLGGTSRRMPYAQPRSVPLLCLCNILIFSEFNDTTDTLITLSFCFYCRSPSTKTSTSYEASHSLQRTCREEIAIFNDAPQLLTFLLHVKPTRLGAKQLLFEQDNTHFISSVVFYLPTTVCLLPFTESNCSGLWTEQIDAVSHCPPKYYPTTRTQPQNPDWLISIPLPLDDLSVKKPSSEKLF